MSTRAEIMRDVGVLECPSWCTQDEEREPDYNQHIGEWDELLINAGADQNVTVRARPRRDWFDANGVEGTGEGFVEIEYLCGGDGCPEWFRTADVQALNAGLTDVDSEANEIQEWVWAYDGADQDAAGLDTAVI